jgi:hypothetical protein
MTTKTIHHITLPSGLVFTSKRDFTETLFTPINGKTADGYFTVHKSAKHGTRGVKLHRGNDTPFAIIVSNGRYAEFKSISIRDGKEWTMNCATGNDEIEAGFRGIGYVEAINACIELVNKAIGKGEA